jgi:hypothetical protein
MTRLQPRHVGKAESLFGDILKPFSTASALLGRAGRVTACPLLGPLWSRPAQTLEVEKQ